MPASSAAGAGQVNGELTRAQRGLIEKISGGWVLKSGAFGVYIVRGTATSNVHQGTFRALVARRIIEPDRDHPVTTALTIWRLRHG